METTPQFFRHGPSLLVRLVFFIQLSLALMVVDTHFKYLYEARQTIAVALYPIQNLAHLPTAISNLANDFFITQDLADENARFKQQHLIDSGKLQQLSALTIENEHLRNLLEATQKNKSKAILAEIRSVPRDPFNLTVILDKGSQNGAQNGQVIVDHLGVIGQITHAYPWSSEATLITDKDHSVPVQILRNGLRSVASGTGKYKTLELNYMANNVDIQEGDQIVTSGIGGVYPSGLPVALVSKIKRDISSAFAYIICTTIAGVDRNKQVLILSPQLPPENLMDSANIYLEDKESEKNDAH
ncbi:MAG: rod shape-determining protein MreC [Nitrosomonadaceae bacterium]|nr:rod shape-determining protein MreC [Nitrosomonadaceae bacterium]